MGIVYTDRHDKFFYVVERYTVDQDDWIRYTNTMGEEFTCRLDAFNERFALLNNQ
jgi:hypothetical protein